MEYIVFCICSIVLARFLEKTSRVISVAHDILFIVLSFAFFFSTNNPTIVSIVVKVVGQEFYNTLHSAAIDTQAYAKLGFSVFFVVESLVILIVSIAAIIIFIKSLKHVVKSVKVKTINDINLSSFDEEMPLSSNKTVIKNQNRYSLKCCLLNQNSQFRFDETPFIFVCVLKCTNFMYTMFIYIRRFIYYEIKK